MSEFAEEVEVREVESKDAMLKRIKDLEFQLHCEHCTCEAYKTIIIRLAARLERVEL